MRYNSVMEINYLKIKRAEGYMYGGDQALFGKRSLRSGCGMIAACDMILYMAGKRSIGFTEYADIVSRFRDNEAYRRTSNPLGIFPGRLVKLINRHITGAEVRFLSRRRFSRESLEKFIRESLRSGFPVIVRIGFDRKKLPYKITYPVRKGEIRSGKTHWHYITVTGISESGALTFSSWGGIGNADCGELYGHFGITGGVIADSSVKLPEKN